MNSVLFSCISFLSHFFDLCLLSFIFLSLALFASLFFNLVIALNTSLFSCTSLPFLACLWGFLFFSPYFLFESFQIVLLLLLSLPNIVVWVGFWRVVVLMRQKLGLVLHVSFHRVILRHYWPLSIFLSLRWGSLLLLLLSMCMRSLILSLIKYDTMSCNSSLSCVALDGLVLIFIFWRLRE